jgi:glycosyltransferase involved in cell wall biosynthesis
MTPKVLIFFPHTLRERHGGPYSFLFHLKEGLKDKQHSIDFLSDNISDRQRKDEPKSSGLLKKLIKPFLSQKLINDRRAMQWINELAGDKIQIAPEYIHQFEILHFHETIDIWRYRDLFKNYKGKILLTTHTPKPYHLELIEDVWKITASGLSERIFEQLLEIDRYAHNKAYALVYACREATESYHLLWPGFTEIINEKRIHYLPTGVKKQVAARSKNDLRKEFNMPADAFVYCFTGRKSAVKGYDLFVNAAKTLLQKHRNIYFLVVGKKEPIPAMIHSNWIETGWTDDVQSCIAASDIMIVPNRYTYFDLSVLETLSLGKPVLLSNTGGNKYFKRFNSPGIFYHEPTVESLVTGMANCLDKKDSLGTYGLENENLYEQFFRCERFAADHITVYNDLA